MKKTALLLLFFLCIFTHAQDKMTTENGEIIFEASVPLFEAVEAKNEAVHCVLNPKKGTIVFVVYIKEFRFKRSLMEEHFNKNYMESKKYPKATFKGIIEKFNLKNSTTTAKEYQIKGKIYIHGKSKNMRVNAQINKTIKGAIEFRSVFSINTDDFDIEIPFLVRNKISKNVTVKVFSELQ